MVYRENCIRPCFRSRLTCGGVTASAGAGKEASAPGILAPSAGAGTGDGKLRTETYGINNNKNFFMHTIFRLSQVHVSY